METVSPITTGQSYKRFDRHKREHRQKKQRQRGGKEFRNVLDGVMGVDLRVGNEM